MVKKEEWDVVFKIEMYGKVVIPSSSKEKALKRFHTLNVDTLVKCCEVKRVIPLGAYDDESEKQ